jgi:hypothetical protein
MNKQEKFDDKRKRVYKQLENTLKIGNKIKAPLSDDERIVLLSDWWCNLDDKCFNFPQLLDKNPYDDTITAEEFMAGFQYALKRAQEYVKEKQLMYPSYGIGDNFHNSVKVVGFRLISDEKLIEKYTKAYKKEQREEEKEKMLAKKSKSQKDIVIVDGKKYKLVK